VADLKLAVTEACGNVVKHAYAGGAGDVDVVFAVDDNRLLMTVSDSGRGLRLPDSVDLDAAPDGPLESGMGMPIIRAIVDELAVEPGADGRGTVVSMVKYLRPAT
jgi:serine/threonine-protein kinase RsbW